MKNKYYQVKVYNKSDIYLTTWSDIISNIEFNNEELVFSKYLWSYVVLLANR